jgi:hypothetical protein
MKAFSLLKLAAEAEFLRLKAMIARQARRAAYGTGAAIFAIGVLTLIHVAAWQALALYVNSIVATLILLGIDFACAAILGLLAARSKPGSIEADSEALRRKALEQARASVAFSALFPLLWRGVSTYRRVRRVPTTRRLAFRRLRDQ